MSRVRRPAVVTERVGEHPAVRAWAEVTSRAVEPACVLVFRERRAGAVYGLPALGVGGSAVFAKRSRAARIAIERFVYEAILPELPVNSPRYYGSLVNGEYGWIFVEDVGSERYRQSEPGQREAAARWLAAMHTGAVGIEAARSLPGAGPERYLQHLRAGRERILHGLEKGAFASNEVGSLEAAVSACDLLEERWARVEALCEELPETLVHCDFQPKNAFVRGDAAGLELWTIDWEMAGFGIPAADLTRIDLRSWWSAVRPHWPHVGFETVERLARAGQVFQWVAAVDWKSASLECAQPRDRSDAADGVEICRQRLVEAARAAGVLG